jgi:hypothetical protein
MSKKVWIPVLVSVFVAAAIFLSVGAYRVVNAAASQQGWGGRGIGGSQASEELAQALGITVDELTAAQQKAKEAAITQALDQGLITQAQADQMRSTDRLGMNMHFGGRMLGSSTIDFRALLADALGITVDELTAAQQAAHEARLAQAVADGTITQEQADLMLSGEFGMGRGGFGMGSGGRGMHGGRGGFNGMRGSGTCLGTPAE